MYGADVDNGGFDQFFFNNRKKDSLTLDALVGIGAAAHARLFDSACMIARGKRYQSRYERAVKSGDLALAVRGSREGWYERLEKKYRKLKPIEALLESYVRRHWVDLAGEATLAPEREQPLVRDTTQSRAAPRKKSASRLKGRKTEVAPARRKILQEGDVAAIPLPSGGFATGVIARAKKRTDSVVFVYVFGPRLRTRKEVREGASSLTRSRAIYRTKAGVGKDWSFQGRIANFSRTRWPMPEFLRVSSLNGRRSLEKYDDDDPARHVSSTRIGSTKKRGERHLEDGLDGPLALGFHVDELID